jgi:hypothetical protein
MAPGDENAVGTFLEGAEDEDGIDAAGAGELEDPHVGRVLQSARACQVGACVGAPGADEGNYLRFEIVFHKNLFIHRDEQDVQDKPEVFCFSS